MKVKEGNILSKSDLDSIRDQLEEDARRPFTISVFGQSGTGKSSLLNAIFGTDFETNDSEPCTSEPQTFVFKEGPSEIRFVDMPGFGEAKEIDDSRKEQWSNQASESDVILLTLFAISRSVDWDIIWLKDLLGENWSEMKDKLVIVCNKSDLLEVPDGWLLSRDGEQIKAIPRQGLKELIARKNEWVKDRATSLLMEKCTIIYCSAKSGFGLVDLCKEVLSRIPLEANAAFRAFVDAGEVGRIPRGKSAIFVPRQYHDMDKGPIFGSRDF